MNIALCNCIGSASVSSLPNSDSLRSGSRSRSSICFPAGLFASFSSQNSNSIVLENPERSASSAEPLSQSESRTRRLILLRHAKSSREDTSLRDHDRPLSKAGQNDAINIAHEIQKLGWIPELILCSDAARSRETLSMMQEQVREFLLAKVHYISSFYSVAAMDGQTADHIQKTICDICGDDILTVMCMGHNRGWEEAASMFCGTSIELEPCNAALLQTTGRSWQEAFSLAGLGGWKLNGILGPKSHA